MKLMPSVLTTSHTYISKYKLKCIAKILCDWVKIMKVKNNVTAYGKLIQKYG